MSADRWVREEIRALHAYKVQSAAGMIKLDAMENPYRLPDDVRAELGRVLADVALNRYPEPHPEALRALLRRSMGVPEGAGLLLGNGSDEIIQCVALALARPGATLLSIEPSFVMFRMIAAFCRMDYVGVPLRADYSLDADSLLDTIARVGPAVTFIPCPNNPTGNLFDPEVLTRVIEATPGLVVIDEAYHAFSDATFMTRVGRYPNLAVMRTLSKLGLAGVRLGLLAGPADWIAEFDKVRLPYNINVLTQAAVQVVLGRPEVLAAQTRALVDERGRLYAALEAMGVQPYPSAANFILFKVVEASRVFDALKGRGILVKNLSGSHPLLSNCLRVTVGTREENEGFLAALNVSL
jgi:histidinol-phosphate aminotransferase